MTRMQLRRAAAFLILTLSGSIVQADDDALLTDPIGFNYDRLRAGAHQPVYGSHSFADDYFVLKRQISDRWKLHYTLDASIMPQAGAPHGGRMPVQLMLTPVVDWEWFDNKKIGRGSLQFYYQAVNYLAAGVDGNLLTNNLNAATPVNDYQVRENIFSQLTYRHELPGYWLSVSIGQYPISNFDGNQYANNQQVNFINYSLSQNGSQTYPQAGFGVFAQFDPLSVLKISAGIQSARNINGEGIQSRGMLQGAQTSFASISWSPRIPMLGAATYSALYYNQPAVPAQPNSSSGWSLSGSQDLNDKWGLFFRANQASGSPNAIRSSLAGGVINNNPLKRNPLDQIGMGLAYNHINLNLFADQSTRPYESILEGYWAWTVGRMLQVTPDVQVYMNPAQNKTQKAGIAYSLRGTILF